MAQPLRPPRMTGKPEVDLAGIVEFLWSWYRAIVLENEYVRNQDIGDNVQPANDKLTAISSLEAATDKLMYFTGATSLALTSISEFARTLLDDGSASVMRGTLGLGALATQDSVSAALLTNGSVTLAKLQNIPQDTVIGRFTASTGVPELITLTSAGRALIDDADASAQRTTLGLGTIATQNQGIDAAVALAKLTAGGTNGSATFTKGILTAYVAPT